MSRAMLRWRLVGIKLRWPGATSILPLAKLEKSKPARLGTGFLARDLVERVPCILHACTVSSRYVKAEAGIKKV